VNSIIYIHAIDERRVKRPTRLDISSVRRVCPNEPQSSFILVTTMWKEDSFKDGAMNEEDLKREEDLKTKEAFFKHFADHGVQFIRYPDSDRNAAQEIVRSLLKTREEINLSPAKEGYEKAKKYEHKHRSAPRRSKVSQLLQRLFGVGKRER
jgi:hypothetical protein